MEVIKYNPFVVEGASLLVPQSLAKTKPKPKPKRQLIPKAKTKSAGSTRERSSKPKTKLKARLKLKGLSLENKNKLDITFAKGFVKARKKFDKNYNYAIISTIALPSLFTLISFLVNTNA